MERSWTSWPPILSEVWIKFTYICQTRMMSSDVYFSSSSRRTKGGKNTHKLRHIISVNLLPNNWNLFSVSIHCIIVWLSIFSSNLTTWNYANFLLRKWSICTNRIKDAESLEFCFVLTLVPNNDRYKPNLSSINYDFSAQPRWRPSRPIRGRMGPRTGPGLGLVPSGGPSPTCPSRRSSSSWSGPSSSSGSSASWPGPGTPDADEVGVSKSPSGVETIIIKSTSSSLSSAEMWSVLLQVNFSEDPISNWLRNLWDEKFSAR